MRKKILVPKNACLLMILLLFLLFFVYNNFKLFTPLLVIQSARPVSQRETPRRVEVRFFFFDIDRGDFQGSKIT